MKVNAEVDTLLDKIVKDLEDVKAKDIQIINNNTSALDSLQGQGESFHPKITCKDNIEQVFDIIQLWNGLEFNYYEKTEYLE